MAKKNILIVPGDGIGQEVTAVGKKVLDKIATKFGHEFTYDEALIGHVAIEATGNPLPEESLVKMKNSDAVLFGAVGHPKYDNGIVCSRILNSDSDYGVVAAHFQNLTMALLPLKQTSKHQKVEKFHLHYG